MIKISINIAAVILLILASCTSHSIQKDSASDISLEQLLNQLPARDSVESALVFNAMLSDNEKRATKITPGVQDAVGELVNTVADGARSEFSQMGRTFNLAIPTVVLGRQHKIIQDVDVPAVVVPMKIDGYPFALEICIKVKNGNGRKGD